MCCYLAQSIGAVLQGWWLSAHGNPVLCVPFLLLEAAEKPPEQPPPSLCPVECLGWECWRRRFWGAAGDAGPVGCLCHGLAIPTQPLCIWPSAPPHAAATGNISSINQIIPLTRLNLLLSKPLHHLSMPSQQGSGGSSWITAGCSESSGAAVCSQRLSGYQSECQGRAGAGNGGCCLLLH